MNNINKNIILIVLVIIALISGYGIAIMSAERCQSRDPDNTYMAGWQAARERLVAYGDEEPEEDAQIEVVSGTIKKKNNDSLEVKIVPFEILSDPELNLRVIKIDSNTVIKKYQPKDQEQYRIEVNEFTKKRDEDPLDENNKLPSSYIMVDIGIEDLAVGQTISIDAGENIRYKKSFVAKLITSN